jgi:hypothetical protein
MNGSLKGTALAIFNGTRKNTKQFIQEFTIYQMINQDSLTMWNAYTCTALALSFIRCQGHRGPSSPGHAEVTD